MTQYELVGTSQVKIAFKCSGCFQDGGTTVRLGVDQVTGQRRSVADKRHVVVGIIPQREALKKMIDRMASNQLQFGQLHIVATALANFEAEVFVRALPFGGDVVAYVGRIGGRQGIVGVSEHVALVDHYPTVALVLLGLQLPDHGVAVGVSLRVVTRGKGIARHIDELGGCELAEPNAVGLSATARIPLVVFAVHQGLIALDFAKAY